MTDKEKIMEFVRANPGNTSPVISRALQIKPGNVYQLLKRLIHEGKAARIKKAESVKYPNIGEWIYFPAIVTTRPKEGQN